MEKDSKEEMRKGPWTEQEDMQLVLYVNMFGDRRWDFIAKVSGLKRSGKSCRLRWVNYLHPGLKRGKITPHEERLVLELHKKWGNRWSKIAQKLPGRTDNEIKNYWRTLMRKKAQERKKGVSSSSSSSSLSSNNPVDEFNPSGSTEIKEQGNSFYDTGGVSEKKNGSPDEEEERSKTSSMEELWKEFEFSEDICSSHMISPNTVESPVWDYSPISDTLWSVDEEESKLLMKAMAMGTDDHFYPFPFSNYFM